MWQMAKTEAIMTKFEDKIEDIEICGKTIWMA